MARIDFHSNVADKLEYACRLTRKMWSAIPEGQPVRNVVMVGEKADLKKLDELLWTFSSTDFCHIALLMMRLLLKPRLY
jgi:DNA polymerase-3 subunit chi